MTKTDISFAENRALAAETVRPQDLFAKCRVKEQRLAKLNVRDQVHQGLKEYLFIYHPLFVTVLPGRYERLCAKLAEERYPFDFSIGHQKDAQVSEPEWRYRQILGHLKKLIARQFGKRRIESCSSMPEFQVIRTASGTLLPKTCS